MPPKGFRTITISEELYQQIILYYKQEKAVLRTKGIRSLSTWTTIELHKSLKRLGWKFPKVK